MRKNNERKKDILTALKNRVIERKKELSEWIESSSEATQNEMLQHNFLVDIENELNKIGEVKEIDKDGLLIEVRRRMMLDEKDPQFINFYKDKGAGRCKAGSLCDCE
jgi:hypothetical protein